MNTDVFWNEITLAQRDARANAIYWDLMAGRHKKIDLSLKITLATIAIVCTAIARMDAAYLQWTAIITSTAAAVSTAILPMLKYSRFIATLESDRVKWIEIADRYDCIVADLKMHENWSAGCDEFKRTKKLAQRQAVEFDQISRNKKLHAQAKAEVEALFQAKAGFAV